MIRFFLVKDYINESKLNFHVLGKEGRKKVKRDAFGAIRLEFTNVASQIEFLILTQR